MYVIAVYDVNEERVQKVHKIFRKYLYWKQRSVFEGEISPAKLKALEIELKSIIRDDDYVLIYVFKNKCYDEIISISQNKINKNNIIF